MWDKRKENKKENCVENGKKIKYLKSVKKNPSVSKDYKNLLCMWCEECVWRYQAERLIIEWSNYQSEIGKAEKIGR